jgi:metal-sulfur cluster biosynthetic enzyme
MPGVVYNEVKQVEGIKDVKVELVFDPPWDKDMISEAALLELGLL